MSSYSDTARALASQISSDDPISPIARSERPHWSRRSPSAPSDTRPKWLQDAGSLQRKASRLWLTFTPVQQGALIIFNVVLLVLVILGLIYNERIFAYLAPAAARWRNLSGGWLILWFMTFFVSFPPMIGYSTCVTVAGFVFGMRGWLIVSTATVIGSTCAFLASRSVLKDMVSRRTEENKRFQALALVLKHDGLKLLLMIRLCPLPYSLSNGAISTIPTVTWYNFALATAAVSPKLLLHVFIGSRLGDLAENGDKMDFKTRLISYVSITVGMVAGIATGYFIYIRTKARAKELEAEEVEGGLRAEAPPGDFADDPDTWRGDDEFSMHTQDDDVERGRGYVDDYTDDEAALERDVFAVGDGEDNLERQKSR